MQRVLAVSLSHVIRSIAFLVLPFSFIALIAWATAGSATGNTTDPIRGAIWIFLGAHHIPFQLALPPTGIAGYLTFLPIGGILLPFFIIRSSFNRNLEKLKGDYHDVNAVRLSFSIIYTLIVTLLAFLSSSVAVTPQWYLAPLSTFLISLCATISVGQRLAPSRALRVATRIFAVLVGTAFITLAILILINFAQVKNITTSLQPGIFGGLLLLLLNILYLPNAAVAVAAYFSGTGLAVGAGTLISPFWYHLGQIPALPLLGVLPVNRQPLALIGIVFFVALGVLLARITVQYGIQAVLQSYLFTVVAAILCAYFASGSLITSEMGAMGVSIWKFALSLALEIGIGLAATVLILNKAQK
jgi:hypothetical protein